MSERLSLYDHLQLRVGQRIVSLDNRPQRIRSVVVLFSIALLTLIDASNTDIDACVYTVKGSEDSLVETISSFEATPENAQDLISGTCKPSLS